MKIAVVGLWHQGVVAAGCFAETGYEVTAADPYADTIDASTPAGRRWKSPG